MLSARHRKVHTGVIIQMGMLSELFLCVVAVPSLQQLQVLSGLRLTVQNAQ